MLNKLEEKSGKGGHNQRHTTKTGVPIKDRALLPWAETTSLRSLLNSWKHCHSGLWDCSVLVQWNPYYSTEAACWSTPSSKRKWTVASLLSPSRFSPLPSSDCTWQRTCFSDGVWHSWCARFVSLQWSSKGQGWSWEMIALAAGNQIAMVKVWPFLSFINHIKSNLNGELYRKTSSKEVFKMLVSFYLTFPNIQQVFTVFIALDIVLNTQNQWQEFLLWGKKQNTI